VLVAPCLVPALLLPRTRPLRYADGESAPAALLH
jgi:hypothetical protein